MQPLPTPEKPKRQMSADLASVAGSASGGTPQKASTNIVRHFQNAQAEQEKEIMDSIAGNLELQMVVKACIKEYKENLELAENQGQSLGDLVADTVRQRKRKRTAGADEADGEDEKDDAGEDDGDIEVPTGQLRRGQLVFGNWTKKLLDEVLGFLDKTAMDPIVLKALTAEAKKECLEIGTGVKCFGDELDRVGNNDKAELFHALKRVYIKNGRPFNLLEVDMDKGEVAWDSCAPWTIVSQSSEPAMCTVFLAAWASGGRTHEVRMDSRNFFDDKGPFKIVYPFSLRQAAVKSESTGDTFTLMTQVPHLKRRVLRQASDEGAANPARKSFQQAKDELKEKRASAKKGAAGVRKLGKLGAPDAGLAGAAAACAPPPPAAAQASSGGGAGATTPGASETAGAASTKATGPPQAEVLAAAAGRQESEEEYEEPPPPPPAE